MKDRPTRLADQVNELEDPAFDTFMEKVTGGDRKSRPEDSYVHIDELGEAVDKVRKERGQFKGFSTGYKVLDDKMGGLEKGSVVLSAARPRTARARWQPISRPRSVTRTAPTSRCFIYPWK